MFWSDAFFHIFTGLTSHIFLKHIFTGLSIVSKHFFYGCNLFSHWNIETHTDREKEKNFLDHLDAKKGGPSNHFGKLSPWT